MIDKKRLQELNWKIKNNKASSNEKLEYMTLLHQNGNITSDQLHKYRVGKNKDDLLKGAMIVGGTLLVAWILEKILEE